MSNAFSNVFALLAGGSSAAVNSFMGRTGAISLLSADVSNALAYVPIGSVSPALSGTPTAPTAVAGNSTTQLANTAFTTTAIATAIAGISGGGGASGVSSFNTRTGAISLTSLDVTTALGLTPIGAGSPALSGTPTAPTALGGTNTSQLATTAFVAGAVSNLVNSFNSRTGAVTLSSADVSNALTYAPAPAASPAFTGAPTAPTAVAGNNTTQLATTAFVQGAVTGAGVSSFNTRTGPVSLTGADTQAALRSITPNLEYTETASWTGEDRSSMFISRNANYTGGGVNAFGNRCVGKALQVNTVTNTTHTNAEYAFWAGIQSYANIDPAAVTIGQTWPQNLGAFAGGFQYGTAPVWAANFSVQNKSGVAQAAGRGAIVGLELNVGITGVDNFQSSIGIDAVPQPMTGTTCNPWVAYMSAGDTNVKWQYGFYAKTGTTASFYSNAPGIRGMDLAGNYAVGLDLSTATISNSAIRVKANDFISLDGNDQFRLKLNSANESIEFYNLGTRRGFISLAGGADVNLAGVDFTSTQTVGGNKTFTGATTLSGGAIINGVWVSAGQTINFAGGAANVRTPTGALAGQLRVVIDGTAYWLDFKN